MRKLNYDDRMSFPSKQQWPAILAPGDERFAADKFYEYYRVKYGIAAELKPDRIAEIGVRYGYSACAFLSAMPEAAYTGFDKIGGGHGGVAGDTFEFVRPLLSGRFPSAQIDLIHADSQTLDSLGGPYDLIHIDGDHTERGCSHDLRLAFDATAAGGSILVDDYDYIAGVSEAVDKFVDQNAAAISRHYYRRSLRGEYIIEKKG